MADDLSIFKEIDDSLRAERMEMFWRQNSRKIVTLCAAILIATAASVAWKNHLHSERTQQTSRIIAGQNLARAGKAEASADAFTQAEEGVHGLQVLAIINRARELLAAGHKEAALGLYLEVAADTHADDTLRDLGALQASELDTAKAPELLAQAAQHGHPYAYLARQMQVANLIQAGKKAEAKAQLQLLLSDGNQPASERERAEQLDSMLAGDRQ